MIEIRDDLTGVDYEKALDWLAENGYYNAMIGDRMAWFKLTDGVVKSMTNSVSFGDDEHTSHTVTYLRGGYGEVDI